MTYNEFQNVVDSYEAAKAKAIAECELEPVGIDVVYVNAKGEEKSLTIRNPRPSTQHETALMQTASVIIEPTIVVLLMAPNWIVQ